MKPIIRCEICNYTSTEGSDLRDVEPSRGCSVAFSSRYNRTLCWECMVSIQDVAQEYEIADELLEDAPTVPVREES